MKKTEDAEAFMDRLDHPFKAEVQELREIIKGVSPDITEQINPDGRRMAYFADMDDVKAKQSALEHVVKALVTGAARS